MHSEIDALRIRAADYAAQGDIVSAILLDALAVALEHGQTWSELLDDVQVRVPDLN
jgi:hypothetical protein